MVGKTHRTAPRVPMQQRALPSSRQLWELEWILCLLGWDFSFCCYHLACAWGKRTTCMTKTDSGFLSPPSAREYSQQLWELEWLLCLLGWDFFFCCYHLACVWGSLMQSFNWDLTWSSVNFEMQKCTYWPKRVLLLVLVRSGHILWPAGGRAEVQFSL